MTTTSRRSRTHKRTPPSKNTTPLHEALNKVASTLEHALAKDERKDLHTRATALAVRAIARPNGRPNPSDDEHLRAAFYRTLDAIRNSHPTGPAALLTCGLAFETRRAAFAFADTLLGDSVTEYRLAWEIARLLPGFAAISAHASNLAPNPDPRLDTLRAAVIRTITQHKVRWSRIRIELERLSDRTHAAELARSTAAQIRPGTASPPSSPASRQIPPPGAPPPTTRLLVNPTAHPPFTTHSLRSPAPPPTQTRTRHELNHLDPCRSRQVCGERVELSQTRDSVGESRRVHGREHDAIMAAPTSPEQPPCVGGSRRT